MYDLWTATRSLILQMLYKAWFSEKNKLQVPDVTDFSYLQKQYKNVQSSDWLKGNSIAIRFPDLSVEFTIAQSYLVQWRIHNQSHDWLTSLLQPVTNVISQQVKNGRTTTDENVPDVIATKGLCPACSHWQYGRCNGQQHLHGQVAISKQLTSSTPRSEVRNI